MVMLLRVVKPQLLIKHDGNTMQRLQALQQCIIEGNSLLETAYKNLPNGDAEHILKTIPKEAINEDLNIRLCLVINLLNNPICESCGNKDDPDALLICKKCCAAWYCNDTCANNHKEIHDLRCCRLDGPLNMGYQQIAICNIEEKK